MAKPQNMTEMRDQMLDVIKDMETGGIRVADAKERFNGYGKIISSCKVQLEQRVFMKDLTPLDFLKGE